METLWNAEDKFKISTQQATIIFVCIASLVICLCVVTILMRMKRKSAAVNYEPELGEPIEAQWPHPKLGWGQVKKALMGSVRWSNAGKWEERQKVAPLLVVGGGVGGYRETGWQSHNSMSAVWKRPILMGEKCEMPRFSGLILYDQSGKAVRHDDDQIQEQTVARTTLKDLL